MLMSERQREKLMSYRQHVVSERTAKARARVKESLSKGRQVTPLLKVKVAGLHPADIKKNTCKCDVECLVTSICILIS